MLTQEQLLEVLKNEVEKVGSANKFAIHHGIPISYIYNVLNGLAKPGPKICKSIGYRRVVRFKKARRYDKC